MRIAAKKILEGIERCTDWLVSRSIGMLLLLSIIGMVIVLVREINGKTGLAELLAAVGVFVVVFIAWTDKRTKERTREISRNTEKVQKKIAQEAKSYDPIIFRLYELERKKAFVSARWFREVVLAGKGREQSIFQEAINKGLIRLYKVKNPDKPDFPTTACAVNKKHPLVGEILEQHNKVESPGAEEKEGT